MMCSFCCRNDGEEGARLVLLVPGRLRCEDGTGCKKGYLVFVPPDPNAPARAVAKPRPRVEG